MTDLYMDAHLLYPEEEEKTMGAGKIPNTKHSMVTIQFPNSSNKYTYRTKVSFEPGEQFEMMRGRKKVMVYVADMSDEPLPNPPSFDYKWISPTEEDGINLYRAEV